MYRAILTKVAKPALTATFRYAGRIPEQIYAGYKRSSSKKSKQVGAMEYLSGGGTPSVSELASIMANIDAILASDGQPRSFTQRVLDSIMLQLRQLGYEIYFLLLRLVGMIVGYAFCAAVMYGVVYLLFIV